MLILSSLLSETGSVKPMLSPMTVDLIFTMNTIVHEQIFNHHNALLWPLPPTLVGCSQL